MTLHLTGYVKSKVMPRIFKISSILCLGVNAFEMLNGSLHPMEAVYIIFQILLSSTTLLFADLHSTTRNRATAFLQTKMAYVYICVI